MAGEVAARFPKVQRRVGGYNLDALVPEARPQNLAELLVGSEGTLAFFTQIELQLSPPLGTRTVGACHFGSFSGAMSAAQHIVTLGPIAVELIDRTLIELGRRDPHLPPDALAVRQGTPEAVLLVEFAEPQAAENARRLQQLRELMGELGYGWDQTGRASVGWSVSVIRLSKPRLPTCARPAST